MTKYLITDNKNRKYNALYTNANLLGGIEETISFSDNCYCIYSNASKAQRDIEKIQSYAFNVLQEKLNTEQQQTAIKLNEIADTLKIVKKG